MTELSNSEVNNKIETIGGHIYVIYVREFIRMKENIVKIGRTHDIFKRFLAYPKGSTLLYTMYVNDTVKTETAIIKRLKETFICRTDYGNEYFEGDINEMIKVVKYITSLDINEFRSNYLHKLNGCARVLDNIETDSSTIIEDTPQENSKVFYDKEVVIVEFIKRNREDLADKVYVSSIELYKKFIDSITENEYGKRIKVPFNYFIATIKNHFDVTVKRTLVDGLECQAIYFSGYSTALDDFIKRHLVKEIGSYCTLKSIKKLYRESEVYDPKYNIIDLKKDIYRVLGVKCHEQKRIGINNYTNVFMDYTIV